MSLSSTPKQQQRAWSKEHFAKTRWVPFLWALIEVVVMIVSYVLSPWVCPMKRVY